MNETRVNATEWEATLATDLLLYISSVLFVVGITGNLLTLLVVHTKEYRTTSASVVLGSLAVADSAQLLTSLLAVGITETKGLDITGYNAATCKLSMYMTSVFWHLSPALIVTMTIERLISVFAPFQTKTLCTKYRMTIAVTVATFIVLGLNFALIFVFTKRSFGKCGGCGCGPVEKSEYAYARIWPWVDFVLASLLPSTIIVIGNALIIYKLCVGRNAVAGLQVTRAQKSTTMTLILVSVCFVLLTWPSFLLFVVRNIGYTGKLADNQPNYEFKMETDLMYTVTTLMFIANGSVNFFLYCLSGSKFRGAFCGLFSCGRSGTVEGRHEVYVVT